MLAQPPSSTDARLTISEGDCVLTYQPLDVNEITMSVRDNSAGATAIFIGTTRNSFEGKVVTRLQYQAYSKLAINTMANIIRSAHNLVSRSDHAPVSSRVTALVRCAVHHRLGDVEVGQPSIVIAVSSPHRKESFRACEFILEEVKLKAQIWKREFYDGADEEDAEWKANSSG